mmetsp:Transcript_9004/g.21932  ORF Transcript_9004/g.21932 Transcript_9004/m.21932 type:complete len:167 (+) Transcript_9004:867-1367(+)
MRISIPRRYAFSIVAIAMNVVASLRNGCVAFSSLPSQSGINRILRSHPAKSHVRLNISSSLPTCDQTFLARDVVERELKEALEFARDIDRKHGLCTEPSKCAWALVDELHQTIENSRVGESGSELSTIQQARSPIEIAGQGTRRKISLGKRAVTSERKVNGKRYFF